MKLIRKISTIALGVAMAAGVGVSVGHVAKAAEAKNVVSTLTFTKACGGVGEADDEVAWTITSDAAESTYDGTKGIHYGTGKLAVSYLTLTSEEFEGTISSVTVNASGASKTAATISCKVGGTDFGTQNQSITSTATNYTFTGSAKGAVVVSLEQDSATIALYVKSIVVAYDDGESVVNVTSVALKNKTANVLEQETVELEATVSPADASNKNVSWSSDNEEVATVENGIVTGVKPGTATITVETEDGKFTDTCVVTVAASPYKIDTLSKANLDLGSGYTKYQNKSLISSAEYFLYVTTNGTNIQSNKNSDAAKHYGIVTTKTGGIAKSVQITFADNNTNPYNIYGSNTAYTDPDNLYSAGTKGTLIESVSESKVVEITTPYQYLGFYSPSGANYIAEIKVKWEPVKPTSISLAAASSTTVTIGNTETIVPTFVNSSDLVVTAKDLLWSSNNEGVATVSNGVVTALTAGKATITATSVADENIKGTIDIDVSAETIHVESVSVSPTSLALVDGEEQTLTATVLPAGASDKSVTWTSSNEGVATVVDGVVTGVAEGNAVITATTTDGSKTATCDVSVTLRERLTFELVTDESMLIPGAQYIFVTSHTVSDVTTYYSMIHYQSSTFLGVKEISEPESSMITEIKDEIISSIYVLGGESGQWTFGNGDKYLYAAGTGSSKNQMKEGTTLDGKAKWSIDFGEQSVATIIANESEGNTLLCYNYNNGSPRFACYASTSATIHSPQLYRLLPQEGSAEAYASAFLDQTGTVCAAAGDHEAGLEAIWSDLAEMYNGLGSDEKSALVAGDASALIKSALERYDYLVARYGLTPFIENHDVASIRTGFVVNKSNNNSAIIAIVVVSLVSITSLGVLITLKKRKALNK